MYDLSGKVVYSENTSNLQTGSTFFIDVKHLAPGMYFLALITEKGTSVERVAVAH
jgi:hypothetical protein